MADITPIASLNGEISPIASLTGELAMPEKVLVQGPPSGVQSDWNQNDSTALDYVKNRPFYEELESVTVEGGANNAIEGFPVFAVGDTVTVSVDGVEYSLVAYDDEGFVTIGDTYSSLENGGGQLGWQFYVAPYDGKVHFSATEAHTVSYLVPVYHTIDPKYLPENLATKTEVQSAQTAADNAQTAADNAQTAANAAQATASAKFQLMRQTTVKTTTTIGTVSNLEGSGPVSVKGLNIAVGSTIKFTSDGGRSGTAVWDGTDITVYMQTALPGPSISLSLELLQDGETYRFTNQTTATTLSNLVIEYEKVEIPKTVYTSRFSGAWLPPYLIANCLYLTKDPAGSDSTTLYRITVDDTGTLKATEVT